MGIKDSKRKIIRSRGYSNDLAGRQYDLYISSYKVGAEYLADRIGDKNKTVAELCCGIGVATIELAKKFKNVVVVDIDRSVLKNCKTNLRNEGLFDKVEFILGDVSKPKILESINADMVIYDIPYWVPKVLKDGELNINKNPDLEKLIQDIQKIISRDIIIFSPPGYEHVDILNTLGICEFQKVFVNGKHDRNYIYFGNCIQKEGITKIELFTN